MYLKPHVKKYVFIFCTIRVVFSDPITFLKATVITDLRDLTQTDMLFRTFVPAFQIARIPDTMGTAFMHILILL